MSTNIFVSIVTPTYNRRYFIKRMIKNYMSQTYPKENMEWIIIDDGSDKVKDIFDNYQDETNNSIKNLHYIGLSEKITLGKKRNMLNRFCKGDIILNMDDDDYYFPNRVLYSVEMLLNNSKYMIAGCSALYMYNIKSKEVFKFGPYDMNHSTAATFCFKKELLSTCEYDETKEYGEEKSFLKDYTIPILQLNPLQCILVCNHDNNTCDRSILLENYKKNKYVEKKKIKLEYIITNKEVLKFYENIKNTKIDDKRVYYKNEDGTSRIVNNNELIQLLQIMKKKMNQMNKENEKLSNYSQKIILLIRLISSLLILYSSISL